MWASFFSLPFVFFFFFNVLGHLSYLQVKHKIVSLPDSFSEGGLLTCDWESAQLLSGIITHYSTTDHDRRQLMKEKIHGTPTQCAITWLTLRCYWSASFTSFVVEGGLMLMLMLNLIKLQHALGASISNGVMYSRIHLQKYTFMIHANHTMYVPQLHFSSSSFFLFFFTNKFCFTRFIELAVKQVQF